MKMHARQLEKRLDCSPDIAVELVTEVTHLHAIVPSWMELARDALEPNPLYEPAKVLAASADAAGLECALVWIRDPERSDLPACLAALLPFRRAGRCRGFPVRTLRAWAGARPAGMAPQCIPLLRAAHARRALAALLARLQHHGVGVVEFPCLPRLGGFVDVLAEVLRGHRSTVFAEALPSTPADAAPTARYTLGLGAVGEMWVSMLPLLARTRRRIGARRNGARSVTA